MIGSFLTRALVMVFGYVFPAYECYKTVEKNKPEIELLRFWCQYWILVAVLTVCERIVDAFISWVPMYSEAKLAFFIYLWYPKTKGTTYVYDSFFRPYVSKHETEIDRNLLELRTRAGDIAALYWQRATSYGQTRIYDLLQFFAAQSIPSPSPAKQRPAVRVVQPPSPNRQPTTATEPQTEEPPSPASRTSSDQQRKEVAGELNSSQLPKGALPVAALTILKSAPETVVQSASAPVEAKLKKVEAVPAEASSQPPKAASPVAALTILKSISAPETVVQSASAPAEPESKKVEAVPALSSSENENGNPPPKETVMEESIRVTRGRLRKTRSAGNR